MRASLESLHMSLSIFFGYKNLKMEKTYFSLCFKSQIYTYILVSENQGTLTFTFSFL